MRITRARAARNLAYIQAELDRPALSPERRDHLTEKAAWYRRVLAGSCRRCGRTLTDDESLRLGLGPECRKAVAVASTLSTSLTGSSRGFPAVTHVERVDGASTA